MNRNYDAPRVSPEWADSRQTHMAVATAIHAIADDKQSPEAIWNSPTPKEWDKVKRAVEDYVRVGDFPFDPAGYAWGKHTLYILNLSKGQK